MPGTVPGTPLALASLRGRTTPTFFIVLEGLGVVEAEDVRVDGIGKQGDAAAGGSGFPRSLSPILGRSRGLGVQY